MYLRDLAICATWHIKEPQPKRDTLQLLFNGSTHSVVEVVLAWIPRNTVELDNLAKLNVHVGHSSCTGATYEKYDNIGTYYVPDFDFNSYCSMNVTAQQDAVLKLLETAFGFVAKKTKSDATLCLEAIAKTRMFGLPLPEINTEAFWKIMPTRIKHSKTYLEDMAFLAKILETNDNCSRQNLAL